MITSAILGLLVGASFAAFLSSRPKDPALPLILAALAGSVALSIANLISAGHSIVAAVLVTLLPLIVILFVAVVAATELNRKS